MLNFLWIAAIPFFIILILFVFNLYNSLFYIKSIFLLSNFIIIDLTSLLLFFFTIISMIPCLFLFKSSFLIKNNKNGFLFFIISIFICGLSISNNMLLFFFFYELLLLASVFLVWLASPNRRSKKTAFYFLFWTQLGSFFVFIGIIILYNFFGTISFSDKFIYSGNNLYLLTVASFFIFIGFSIKVPLWPFHFWLTKTHVEASTGFSIFLSGVLVKTAMLGLLKFKFIFFFLNEYFLFFIISYGIIDVSFKLYSQVDLKKLIAYATIQEMGLLMLLIAFDSIYTRQVFIYFCFFHTAISGIFFLLNEFIYKRFNSRHLSNISGLCTTHPNLFLVTIISLFIFLGFPFSIKFFIEIQILYKIISSNLFFGLLFIFIVQYISIVFFFKNIIFSLFGPININRTIDLTSNEYAYYFYFMCIIIILSFF